MAEHCPPPDLSGDQATLMVRDDTPKNLFSTTSLLQSMFQTSLFTTKTCLIVEMNSKVVVLVKVLVSPPLFTQMTSFYSVEMFSVCSSVGFP